VTLFSQKCKLCSRIVVSVQTGLKIEQNISNLKKKMQDENTLKDFHACPSVP
jgi:hypothetical protein